MLSHEVMPVFSGFQGMTGNPHALGRSSKMAKCYDSKS
jgi:hypothetical protein